MYFPSNCMNTKNKHQLGILSFPSHNPLLCYIHKLFSKKLLSAFKQAETALSSLSPRTMAPTLFTDKFSNQNAGIRSSEYFDNVSSKGLRMVVV
jgi:hypothetical protein